MIKPYASEQVKLLYVENETERDKLKKEAANLPPLILNSAAASNAIMLASGYFTPLKGYMNLADSLSIAENMTTEKGMFWPVPIVNCTKEVSSLMSSSRIALYDPNASGHDTLLAVQDVTAIEHMSEQQQNTIMQNVFGTLDDKHPGVATFKSHGRYLVSGPISVLNYSYFKHEFPTTFKTASQIRAQFVGLKWNKIVAFQTRNPMHRAHEELCKIAQAAVQADGILIHMLLGKLKAGDIPAQVRDAAIRKMVELYFPPNSVMISGYGFDMLYAGPREALLHAIFRQNAGCTHLIVGRDHAGVGDYYDPFAAQTIFDDPKVSAALQIEIFKADHTAYSKKLDKVVMMRDVPDHNKEDFVLLSGTRVREMLRTGKPLPEEFARPEVAKILMAHYQQT